MSFDNCIAVLITKDKFKKTGTYSAKNMFDNPITTYRVSHVNAVDNFDWYKKNEPHNLGYWMAETFKGEPFYDEKEAEKEILRLSNEIWTEYGTIVLDAREYNFPGY